MGRSDLGLAQGPAFLGTEGRVLLLLLLLVTFAAVRFLHHPSPSPDRVTAEEEGIIPIVSALHPVVSAASPGISAGR
jgi:hypothetical protein